MKTVNREIQLEGTQRTVTQGFERAKGDICRDGSHLVSLVCVCYKFMFLAMSAATNESSLQINRRLFA